MIKKIKNDVELSVKESAERSARRKLLEELFYDFYRSRGQVYWINFVRGLFLGFGTIVGGTVIVTLLIWLLGMFAGWFPGIGDYIFELIKAIQK